MIKRLLIMIEKFNALRVSALISLILISFSLSSRGSDLHFKVSMDDAADHNFKITMTVSAIDQDYTVLKMPVWTPGYYKILDYPKNLSSFKATDENGRILPFEKTSKNIWKINTRSAKTLTVSYVVYSNNHSVAESFIDSTHAFIAPASLFLYPEGEIKSSSTITFFPYKTWKIISTGLERVEGTTDTYFAPDFDILFDSPMLAGNQELIDFTVRGVPHQVAVLLPGTHDRDAVAADYARMVESAVEIIGEIPYRYYTFLIMGPGGGGLEHLNSQAVFTGFRGSDIHPADHRAFLGWMSFIAHEYFHLFNVKTIRPVALGPFDYDRENYTNMLWVSEGFTVYYENVILNRAGFMSPEEMLEALSESITAYESIPGSRVQSVTMSSFDTWINFFNFSDNAPKTTISYYDKGCGLALLLDIKIREATGNKKTLTDVMRTLYYDYHKKMGRGFTDAEFRSECEKAAGCDLGELFGYASSTDRPDYNKYLAGAGLTLEERQPEKAGGKLKYCLVKKNDMKEMQKRIFSDMFRQVEQ